LKVNPKAFTGLDGAEYTVRKMEWIGSVPPIRMNCRVN
jgi:hypothetical protein